MVRRFYFTLLENFVFIYYIKRFLYIISHDSYGYSKCSDFLAIDNVASIHQCEDECMVRQPECKGIVIMLKVWHFEYYTPRFE